VNAKALCLQGAFVYLARVEDALPIRRVRGPDKKPRKRRSDAKTLPRVLTAAQLQQRQMSRDKSALRQGLVITVADPANAPDVIEEGTNVYPDDLAAVVVRRTSKALAAGKLEPTLRDGLVAQQLLDRRAEKAADRQFMLGLAMAMAGGGQQTPVALLPPGDDSQDVTEGEYEEADLAPEHLRQA